jgi:hypothetical protein
MPIIAALTPPRSRGADDDDADAAAAAAEGGAPGTPGGPGAGLPSEPAETPRKGTEMRARRALFLAGVMLPTLKLGRHGNLEAKVAASEIIANLCKEEHNLADIMAKARPTPDPFQGLRFSVSDRSDASVTGLRTQVLNGLLRDRLTAQRRKKT